MIGKGGDPIASHCMLSHFLLPIGFLSGARRTALKLTCEKTSAASCSLATFTFLGL